MTYDEAKQVIDDMPQDLRDVAAQYAFAGDPMHMVLVLMPYFIEQFKDSKGTREADEPDETMDEEPEPRTHKGVEWAGTRSSIAWQTTDYDAPSEDAEPFEARFYDEQVAALLHYTARIAGVEECTVLTELGRGMQFGSFVVQFPQDSVASLKIPFSSGVDCFSAKHVVLLCNALRHHVDGELSEEHDTDGADEDPEAQEAEFDIHPDTDGVRGYGIIGRASNAKYLAEAFAEQRARRVAKQWAAAMEQTPVDDVPPLHEWFGIQGVVRNLDVLETLFAARDQAMMKKIAEDLDRKIMADLDDDAPDVLDDDGNLIVPRETLDATRAGIQRCDDDDTRTLPAPWRDPAEEWPEDGQTIVIMVTHSERRGKMREPLIADVYGGAIHEDDILSIKFRQGGLESWERGPQLHAWMPLPAHPLDSDTNPE